MKPTDCAECMAEFFKRLTLQAEALHKARVFGAAAAEAFVDEELEEIHGEHAGCVGIPGAAK